MLNEHNSFVSTTYCSPSVFSAFFFFFPRRIQCLLSQWSSCYYLSTGEKMRNGETQSLTVCMESMAHRLKKSRSPQGVCCVCVCVWTIHARTTSARFHLSIQFELNITSFSLDSSYDKRNTHTGRRDDEWYVCGLWTDMSKQFFMSNNFSISIYLYTPINGIGACTAI